MVPFLLNEAKRERRDLFKGLDVQCLQSRGCLRSVAEVRVPGEPSPGQPQSRERVPGVYLAQAQPALAVGTHFGDFLEARAHRCWLNHCFAAVSSAVFLRESSGSVLAVKAG